MLVSLSSNYFHTLSFNAVGSSIITMYWSDLTPLVKVYDVGLLSMFSLTLLIGVANSFNAFRLLWWRYESRASEASGRG